MDYNMNNENGRTGQIIDKLVDMIENGQSVPLSTGKVAVNKDETILLLRELENIVNGELKVYREVNDKKGRIITDAKKEAEEIINMAEQNASRIRVTKKLSSGTTLNASTLSKDDKLALRTAHDIYAASLIYTDEMLTEVNDIIAQAYDIIENQYGRMVEVLEEKAEIVAKNKAELMDNLKELSKEERYEQILELSQLLSNELYNERQKATNMIPVNLEKKSAEIKEEHKKEVDIKSEMKTDVKSEMKSTVESEMRPEIKVKAETEAKSGVESEMKPEIKAKAETEIKAEAESEMKSDVKTKDSTLTEITAEAAVTDEEADKAKAVYNSINMFKSYIPKE